MKERPSTILTEQRGNMYPWVGFTWNPLCGKCPHDCSYCYVKKGFLAIHQKYKGEIRLSRNNLYAYLGEGNIIFVCSCIDLFAEKVHPEFIKKILLQCQRFNKNTYLFQSKNPRRFFEFDTLFPDNGNVILGTTIETNRNYKVSNAPPPFERKVWLQKFIIRKMVSIEPIMDFDLDVLVDWIKDIKLEFVSIGADSKNNSLPEPSKEKVEQLIKELRKFTEVKIKPNLKRLYSVGVKESVEGIV